MVLLLWSLLLVVMSSAVTSPVVRITRRTWSATFGRPPSSHSRAQVAWRGTHTRFSFSQYSAHNETHEGQSREVLNEADDANRIVNLNKTSTSARNSRNLSAVLLYRFHVHHPTTVSPSKDACPQRSAQAIAGKGCQHITISYTCREWANITEPS